MITRTIGLCLAFTLLSCASPESRYASLYWGSSLSGLSDSAKPSEQGSEILHVYLSKDNEDMGNGEEIGVAIVIGQEEFVSQGTHSPQAVLTKQQARLRQFATNIEEGAIKDVRKSMQAWAMCVCSAATSCQGGQGSCGMCSTCKSLPTSHGPTRQKYERWPKAMGQMGSRMGLQSADCPPKNIVLLVDTSGSMEERDRLKKLKEVIKESLRHYMSGDVFTLVSFSSTPVLVLPPTTLEASLDLEHESKMPIMMSSQLPVQTVIGSAPKAVMDKTVKKFINAIDSLMPEGKTDIKTALIVASQLARKTKQQRKLLSNPNTINRILLFSDGFHDGDWTTAAEREEFQGLVQQIARNGLSISTFGIGDNFDDKLMSALVDPKLGHSGRFYHVKDEDPIRQYLMEELMFTNAIRNVRVSVKLQPDVEVSAIGNGGLRFESSSGKMYTKFKTFDLKDKRTLSLSVKCPNDNRELGRVRIDFIDAKGVSRFEDRAIRIPLNSAIDNEVVQKKLVAQEEMILQRARISLLQAVKLLDLGKTEYATQYLRQEADQLTLKGH